ncbi:MAG: hypothetical protein U0893_23155 [Chloroflexota bacterium]
MNQVNVNPGGPPVPEETGDRTSAAGINFATMIIVLGIVVVVLWLLFSGPIGTFFRGGTTNVNVNTPSNPPTQTQPAKPTSPPGVMSPDSAKPSSKP